MGDILFEFKGTVPRINIERRVDKVEIQKLQFYLEKDSRLGTETGNSIDLFARDEDGNVMQVYIPISVDELIEALNKYKERN